MSWKKRAEQLKTFSFRLTLLYTLLFTTASCVIFIFIYYFIGINLRQRIDNYLFTEAVEIEVLSYTFGPEYLKIELKKRAEIEGVKDTYIRLFYPNPKDTISSDLASWKGLQEGPIGGKELRGEGMVLTTTSIPGRHTAFRVIDRTVGNEMIVEVGYSLDQYEHMMKAYRDMFVSSIIVLVLCGGIVGWTMARKAMTGVERVTETAVSIGGGDLSKRVPYSHEGVEIDNLVRAFNHMIERIQTLVFDLREVSDNVAHDLKSPLTRIRNMAENVLIKQYDKDACREAAAEIVEECDRMVQMINLLLEIAETDSGAIQIQKDHVNVCSVIATAFELYLPAAEESGITISLDIPPTPLMVRGDIGKLRRMVANLLDNALKYTPRGGSVRIQAQKSGNVVRLSISDTGIGIEEKHLSHIFDKFYRIEESRSLPGHGLGLSFVRSVVQAHEGTIDVVSRPKAGTTFTVILSLFETP